MWVSKTVFRGLSIGAFIALGLNGMLMAGCAAKTTSEKSENALTSLEKSNHISSEMFTTKGKPTKTINTPWGAKEIYDPMKDEDVKLAIKNLYLRQDTSFGEVSRSSKLITISEPEDIELIKTARKTHYFDVLRLGCRQPVEIPCQYYGTMYFKQTCPNLSFGSSQLNECELAKITTDYTDIGGPTVIPPNKRDHLKGENPVYNPTPYMCTIDGIKNTIPSPLYIGAVSGYSLEETTRLLTTVECLEWSNNY